MFVLAAFLPLPPPPPTAKLAASCNRSETLTSLFAAVTLDSGVPISGLTLVTRLVSALTKNMPANPFRFCTYRKRGGGVRFPQPSATFHFGKHSVPSL